MAARLAPAQTSSRPRRSAPPPAFPPVQLTRTLPAHKGAKVIALAWSSSGRYLATAAQRAPIKLFLVLRGRRGALRVNPIRTLPGHTADILHMTFSRTDFLLTASMDRTARLWHAETNLCLRKFLHPDIVTAVTFHPINENYILTGACDGMVRLWRPAEHICIAENDVAAVITAADFSPDGHTAFVGTYDGRVLALDVHPTEDPPSPPAPRKRHKPQSSSPARSLSSREGSPSSSTEMPSWPPRSITDDSFKSVRNLPLYERACVEVSPRRARRRVPPPKVAGLAVCKEAREVVVCGSDSRVHSVRCSGKTEVVSRMRAHSNRKADAIAVKFGTSLSPDGRFLLLDGVGESLRMVDLWQGRENRRGRRKEKEVSVGVEVVARLEGGANVSCAAFATANTVEVAGGGREGGFVVAVGGDDGQVRIFENLGPKP